MSRLLLSRCFWPFPRRATCPPRTPRAGSVPVSSFSSARSFAWGTTSSTTKSFEARIRGGLRNTNRIYKVEQVNGAWLWLQAEKEGVAGWVPAAEVIRYDQAIDYFTNQIRANPSNDAAYTGRGHMWRDKKKFDLALADYNEALRLDPGSEVHWTNRGAAWFAKKYYDKAIADYSEAIRIDPKFASAYNNRGLAWHHRRTTTRPLPTIPMPSASTRRTLRGTTTAATRGADKKEYDKAIADYSEAIRIDPKFAWGHFGRAVTDPSRGGTRDGRDEAGYGDRGRQGRPLDVRRDPGLVDGTHWRRPGTSEGIPELTRGQARHGPVAVSHRALSPWRAGRIGAARLAVDDDKRTEAHGYVGLDLLAKRRPSRAIEHFRWVKDRGNPAFMEYTIALAELDRAGAGTVATSDAGPKREAARPAFSTAGGKKADEPAKVANLTGTTLYVPTRTWRRGFARIRDRSPNISTHSRNGLTPSWPRPSRSTPRA